MRHTASATWVSGQRGRKISARLGRWLVPFAILAGMAMVFAPEASAAPCATALMTVYDAPGFSCNIGDKVFSNFDYVGTAAGTGVLLPASAVTVIPEDFGILNRGFEFTAAWVAPPGGSLDSKINYTVTSLGGLITDNHLAITTGATVTGTGAFGVTEALCLGGPTVLACIINPGTGALLNQEVHGIVGDIKLVDNLIFPFGVSIVGVAKDIAVSAGTNGTAAFSGVLNSVSQVPEPASLLLLGTGLLGAMAAARRRRGR